MYTSRCGYTIRPWTIQSERSLIFECRLVSSNGEMIGLAVLQHFQDLQHLQYLSESDWPLPYLISNNWISSIVESVHLVPNVNERKNNSRLTHNRSSGKYKSQLFLSLKSAMIRFTSLCIHSILLGPCSTFTDIFCGFDWFNYIWRFRLAQIATAFTPTFRDSRQFAEMLLHN